MGRKPNRVTKERNVASGSGQGAKKRGASGPKAANMDKLFGKFDTKCTDNAGNAVAAHDVIKGITI